LPSLERNATISVCSGVGQNQG